MANALQNVVPSHLLDGKLFDFERQATGIASDNGDKAFDEEVPRPSLLAAGCCRGTLCPTARARTRPARLHTGYHPWRTVCPLQGSHCLGTALVDSCSPPAAVGSQVRWSLHPVCTTTYRRQAPFNRRRPRPLPHRGPGPRRAAVAGLQRATTHSPA